METSDRNTKIVASVKETRSLSETAKRFHLTRERIRQIAKKAGVDRSALKRATKYPAVPVQCGGCDKKFVPEYGVRVLLKLGYAKRTFHSHACLVKYRAEHSWRAVKVKCDICHKIFSPASAVAAYRIKMAAKNGKATPCSRQCAGKHRKHLYRLGHEVWKKKNRP